MATLRSSSSWFSPAPASTAPSSPSIAHGAPRSVPSSPSPPSSHPQPKGNKYDTISTETMPRKRIGLGFFDSDAKENVGPNNAGSRTEEEELALKELVGLTEDEMDWNVIVTLHEGSVISGGNGMKKRRGSGGSKKEGREVLTFYVTTSRESLTLLRYYSEFLDLEARLRSQLPGRVPSRSSTSPRPSSHLPQTHPTSSKKSRSPQSYLFQLSRSLTPSSRPNAMSNIDTTEIGDYLTQLSGDKVVRDNKSWTGFFRVRGEDDLRSKRVERRLLGGRRSESASAAAERGLIRSTGLDSEEDEVEMENVTNVTLFPEELDEKRRKEILVMREASEMTTDESMILAGSSEDGHQHHASGSGGMASASLENVESEGEAQEEVEKEIAPTEKKLMRVKKKKSIREPGLTIDDFECLRVLGKGCSGKVLLVRHKKEGGLFALKAIHKQHVLAHRELDHTRTEQSVLKRCSLDQSNPFVVKLHYSFHDSDALYLALDFHPGGDLATQLARWGRLGRDRTRFYTSEIVEGVEGLHRAGVIYRDLKPENILISEAGHVVLTDFGLSKDFGHARIPPSSSESRRSSDEPRPHWLGSSVSGAERSMSVPWMADTRERTSTFCGTAEYLAPEVLLGEAYSYAVDAWSLGTMLYEMLAGVTPFWSEDHATMYRRVLHEELAFNDDDRIFDNDTKSLLRGLLQKDPALRMSDSRIKKHPYFSMIEWPHVFYKRYVPPFIPTLNPLDPSDTSQFDDMYTSQMPKVSTESAAGGEADKEQPEGEPQAAFDAAGRDVFDGYSYFGGRDVDSIVGISDDEVENVVGEKDDDGERAPIEDDTLNMTTPDSTLLQPPATPEPPSKPPASAFLTPASNTSPSSYTSSMLQEEDEHSDSEWDVIDADVGGEARNGGKGTTLWARGVKDRYKLLVSTPRGSSPLRPMMPGSSATSRKGSSTGGASRNSSFTSYTPEPQQPSPDHHSPSSRRLPSASSHKNRLKGSRSQRSLGSSKTAASSSGVRRPSSTTDNTPKKSQAISRLASAFRPKYQQQ